MAKDISFLGKFGLERETLRVDQNGRLAQTKHPFDEEEITRDFCENQVEIVTPVCGSIDEALESLKALSKKAKEKLAKQGEYLWMSSNPPYFASEDEIPVAEFEGALIEKRNYRLKLEKRYGKRHMLYSGIHFNISFCDEYVGEEANSFYLKLLKYALKYSWLVTMLTAASPVYDASLGEDGEKGSRFSGYASMRNGDRGYWNQFVPILDYSNVDAYCDSIQEYVDRGELFSESELYLPVRIKSVGAHSLQDMKEFGVDHLELRMLDLNPLVDEGICKHDLYFAHILLVYFTKQKDFAFDREQQELAVSNQKEAAKMNWDTIDIQGEPIKDAAQRLLDKLCEFFKDDDETVKEIKWQMNKLRKGSRYADKVYLQNFPE